MLVNDNTAEYNVSQEKKKLSRNHPRWRCRVRWRSAYTTYKCLR